MRTTSRTFLLFTLVLLLAVTAISAGAQTALQLITVSPCRLIDTRTNGGPITGGTSRTFNLPQLAQAAGCNSLLTATAYSLNVTVVPQGRLGYLTIWPTGQPQPDVSLMNSLDGRIKANATIVAGGTNGSVDVFVNNTTDVLLDINGFFEPANASALAFYPLAPCRLVDTRTGNGGPLQAGQERDFPILPRSCNIAGNAKAFSYNVTAVPIAGGRVGFVTVWPAGLPRPNVSTLNDPTGTIVANAAIVPSGSANSTAVYANNNTNILIDVNGYFAPPTPSGLSLYTVAPCRALDTRPNPFTGEIVVPIVTSPCGVPASASGFVLNATALPEGRLGYLTVWPDGEPQPGVSTLNATDGAFTSNMAIVAAAGLPSDGSVDAFASNGTTNLLLDVSGYLAAVSSLTITTATLPDGSTGQPYSQQLMATGGEQPYTWSVTSGTPPPGLTLSATGVLAGVPTMDGAYPFTVQVQDAAGGVASQPLTLTVVTGGLVITTTQLPAGTQNVAYDATLQAGGGTPPYTWSIATGTLPAGLNLAAGSGEITGTPTTLGVSNFTVQVTDSQQGTAQAALQITVNPSTTNGALTGHYAFSFNGYNNGSTVLMAGAFLSDGNGNITSGILDLNSGTGSLSTGYSLTGTYTLAANGLGTIQLLVSGGIGTLNFHISASSGGNGTMIQDNADPNTRGSGQFFVQNSANFNVPPAGGYAIGSFGADQNASRYAKAGAFVVGTAGVVTGGNEDINDNGALVSRNFNGHFGPPTTQNGRGQVVMSFPNGVTNNYAYYVVSGTQFILIGTDAVSANDPLTLGSILAQIPGGFTNASLSGVSMVEMNGVVPNGGSPLADIQLGLFQVGTAGVTLSIDENRGGTVTQQQISSGTYNVATNGRVSLSGFGGTPPLIYLVNANSGFMLGQDANVGSGILEPQTAPPPFSNASILGTYLGGTVTPVQPPVVDAVSFLFADGSGNFNGVQNSSGPSGPGAGNISATYQVDATGRAVVTGTPAGIMYVVSAKKVAFLPNGNNPVLSTFSVALTN